MKVEFKPIEKPVLTEGNIVWHRNGTIGIILHINKSDKTAEIAIFGNTLALTSWYLDSLTLYDGEIILKN